MTTTSFINSIMSHVPSFNGAHSCDTLPQIIFKNSIASLIVNLDPNDLPGSHWVALFFSVQSEFSTICYYYDPLALDCTNKYILKFIHNYTDDIYSNKVPTQHILSNYCGLFTIGFILFFNSRDGKCLINDFNSMFNRSNLTYNDSIIAKYIMNTI